MTRNGVRWSRPRVGQVEAGAGIPDLATLWAVARSLSEMTDTEVRLADLLPADTSDEGTQLLRSALLGEAVRPPRVTNLRDPSLAPGWGPVEESVARRLPGCESLVFPVARRIFDGRTGTQERDRRAGPDSTPQRRGALSRAVIEQLLDAIEQELADLAEQDAILRREESDG